ncbi:Helicase [uncultured virus]|nr:Helicase [uncultured virus]
MNPYVLEYHSSQSSSGLSPHPFIGRMIRGVNVLPRTHPHTNSTIITLDQDSPRVSQPSHLKTQLYQHQLASIHQLQQLEHHKSITIDLSFIESNLTKYLKQVKLPITMGVINDNVGHGKTNIALGFISHKPLPDHSVFQFHVGDSNKTTVELDIPSSCVAPVNVIVVPPSLVDQWIGELSCTTLDYCVVRSMDDVARIVQDHYTDAQLYKFTIDIDVGSEYMYTNDGKGEVYDIVSHISALKSSLFHKHVVITIPSAYSQLVHVMRSCDYDIFARVFIDDLDDLSTTDSFAKYTFAMFTWIISATLTQYDVKDHNCAFVKSQEAFVQESIKLPKINHVMVRTSIDRFVNSISEYIPSNVMSLINAGNIQGAIKKLNCGVDTTDNIIQVITRITRAELNRVNAKIASYTAMLSTHKHVDPICNSTRLKLQHLKATSSRLQDKITHIQTKIKDMLADDCMICMCECTDPVVVKCCNTVMCFACLMKSINNSYHRCPMCRCKIGNDDYTCIIKDANTKPVLQHASVQFDQCSKLDCLQRILTHIIAVDSDARVIICSDHDETFDNMINLNIDACQLISSSNVTDVLHDFQVGEFKVLFLNSQNYGKGLNIQFANYVILYHAMDVATETQVIGRAQRPARTTPLVVIHLRDANEANVTNANLVTCDTDLCKLITDSNSIN